MSGREATALVVRREIRERLREKAFAVSTGVNIVIIVAVVIIASLVGGDDASYTVGWSTESESVVVQTAADAGRAVDVTIVPSQIGSPGPPEDVALGDGFARCRRHQRPDSLQGGAGS